MALLQSCRPSVLSLLSLLVFLSTANSQLHTSFTKLEFSSVGPESLAFDAKGKGPYTGVNDGRILKYQGSKNGFVDFATTAPNRSKEVCDGTTDLGATCGRPLGIEFFHKTGELYIIDAHYGPMVVGPEGGPATQLAPGQADLEGVPADLPDGLDVDPVTGDVYITYAGAIFLSGDLAKILNSNDTAGRLFKYDQKTKEVKVVLTGLSGPFGAAVSADGKFVLITEYIGKRIRKFWIRGSKAGTSEVIVNLEGNPDNIKRSPCGNFWIGVNVQNLTPTYSVVPMGQKINAHGHILETLQLDKEYSGMTISEVHQHDESLYIGTGSTNYVGEFTVLSNPKGHFDL